MLRPGQGTIHGREILDNFPDPYMLAVKLNRTREPEMSQLKRQARREFVVRLCDGIPIDRGLAMHRQSGSRLIARRSPEQIEAEIVSHDAGQKLGIIAGSVPIWPPLLEFGGF